MKYRVILFDLDGTLIDTNELILQSFMHTLETHCPGRYTREDVLAIMGEPLIDQMRRFDESQAEDMVKTYHVHNEANHDRFVKEFPHVTETLEALHKAGVVMGIVSNKRRMVVDMGLKLFGLDRYMDTVVCFGDGLKGKPEPDMILYAMEQLGAKPEETLMVGDSRYDLIAARRAGVRSAAVAWSLHAEELPKYEPDHFLQDMRDLLDVAGVDRNGG
ncbi:pyrophosphatase PpaX [Staphylospora marina]|uniref:pyrophosphatase PpaX n=1 Tax=Staphylospora marina TaxID=2490858 RepID=UPI000F5BACE7|nr:pyrophosphatase PpaX [Staphylospora marina]